MHSSSLKTDMHLNPNVKNRFEDIQTAVYRYDMGTLSVSKVSIEQDAAKKDIAKKPRSDVQDALSMQESSVLR